MRESCRGSLRKCHVAVSETPHNTGKYQRTSSLVSKGDEWKDSGFSRTQRTSYFNKAERPGKHLQLTSAFSLGTPIPHWLYGPGKDPTLRTKKQSVRRKPLRSHRPYGMWNRNQGSLVLWVKHDAHSTETHNLVKSSFQWNVCFLDKSYQNCWWQWKQKAKTISVRNNTVQIPS